ncbi:hypothetical protein [Pseudomonas sp. Q2-TVG4-2]|uniref:hypothetical protein n=1 Tax=Pseudomonas sp. Q2-TVG4-2 TaxID=1685699 RepID=UPI0015E72340|nr:hypothetical protein [Pseudomonas sp. Q2-TVG4-2]
MQKLALGGVGHVPYAPGSRLDEYLLNEALSQAAIVEKRPESKSFVVVLSFGCSELSVRELSL